MAYVHVQPGLTHAVNHGHGQKRMAAQFEEVIMTAHLLYLQHGGEDIGNLLFGIVAGVTVLAMLPIGWLLGDFGAASGLGSALPVLVVGGIAFIALMSFFVAAVCGYMAGLIGASNSPLSGVGILVVIGAALLLAVVVKPLVPVAAGPALVAFALFITAVVFAAATISNDNLQDLKTGQLVDATPWRQQVALLVGVIAGAAIIPPVLGLLKEAYGFAGAPGADPARALGAPQAALISALAQGVIQSNLDWNLIGAGVAIGVVLIGLDEVLKRRTAASLPPLAIGMGIYLPTATTLMIVVGAIVGWAYDRRADRTPKPVEARQLGVLLASGMIVGESLLGVVIAGIVVFSGKSDPLALVGARFADAAVWLGGGAKQAGAAVRSLADRGFGVVTSANGRGIVPENDPMSLGSFTTAPAVEELFATCDALVVVGSRLRGNETLQWKLRLPERIFQRFEFLAGR